jgi:hypothetical protein
MKRMMPVAIALAAMMATFPMAASAQYRNDSGYRNGNGYPDYRQRSDNRSSDRDQGLVWENSQNLNPRQGWQRVTLWVGDPASAVYFEVVSGTIEFDRAEVVFENGQRQLIDMNGVRGPSRFPVARFNGTRNVDRVIVMARPRTYGARLGVWRDTNGSYGWNDRNDRYGNDDWRWRR